MVRIIRVIMALHIFHKTSTNKVHKNKKWKTILEKIACQKVHKQGREGIKKERQICKALLLHLYYFYFRTLPTMLN